MTRGDLKDSLADIEELVDYLKGLNGQEPIKAFDAILEQTCGWRKEFSDLVRAEAEIHKAYIVQARYRLIETITFSERWTVFMESMYRYTLLDSIVAQYLDKDITKQD